MSSGTTAKQLDREPDARPIGYGGMIGESLLGLAAVIACTAGFTSSESWHQHYASWGALSGLGSKMQAFIDGAARFVGALGIPVELARSLIAVMVVSFALTTLDSATRLLRYNVEEIGQSIRVKPLTDRFVSTTLAVASIAFFAFYKIDDESAGLALWQLFGSTNQLLAGLALLVVSLYLIQRGRPALPYLLPMLFMMGSTLVAMFLNLRDYARDGQDLLLYVGSCITLIALWLMVEAVLALRRFRRGQTTDDLDIPITED